MKIVVAEPPNFAAIDARFNVKGKPVYFCYGDTIFNPKGVAVPPSIVAHEMVHSARQGTDPEGWWKKYIDSVEFRIAEEVPAHRAEYLWFLERDTGKLVPKGWRSVSDFHLFHIANRLRSPLYNANLSLAKAKALICAP